MRDGPVPDIGDVIRVDVDPARGWKSRGHRPARVRVSGVRARLRALLQLD